MRLLLFCVVLSLAAFHCKTYKTLVEGDMAFPIITGSKNAPAFAFTTEKTKLWDRGTVSYSFKELEYIDDASGQLVSEPLFKEQSKKVIKEALDHMAKQVPCLHFREVPEDSVGAKLIFSSMGDKDYDGQGCWAYTGKVGSVGGENGQTVNLDRGCINMGIIIHEVMHSMGATHEQNRPDRDDYIIVIEENIDPLKKHNFDKKDSTFSSHSTGYDYLSIMHYGIADFSINGENTMRLKDKTKTLRPKEEKTGLSTIDVMELARVYEKLNPTETCFKLENVLKYVTHLEAQVAELKKSQNKYKDTTTSMPIVKGILIAGGAGALTSTELFLIKSQKTCTLTNIPDKRVRHTLTEGSTDGSNPVMCGGDGGGGTVTQHSCLQFSPTSASGIWTTYANTLQSRDDHTAFLSSAGLVLVGGYGSKQTTELVNGGASFSLKQPTRHACAITDTDQDSTILTGGSDTLNVVARYNLQGWVENLPELSQGRRRHGCGSFTKGNSLVLVVAGGYSGSAYLSSTETYSPGSSTTWSPGQSLPRTMGYMASVSLDYAVVLIGGYDGTNRRDEILAYNGTWSQLGKMKIPRSAAAATKMSSWGSLICT